MTSVAASPIRGPMAGESPSAGPVGMRDAKPRPRPLRLAFGWVIRFSSLRNRSSVLAMSSFGNLTAGVEIAQRSAGARVVVENRHPVAGRLGNLHAPWDNGPQYFLAEV